MYKLNQHSLTRGVWFEPETQSMTLAERNTVSSITLGPDAPEIGFNDWILDEDWPEGPTVWRVKSIDDQTDSKTVTVSLEHVIRLLEDIKLFEAVETGDISGGDYCTARQAIEYLLAQQDDWVLGDLRGDDVSLPYEFSGGDSLLDAIESVSDTLEDAEWWYDLSRYPFVLHIRKRNSSVMSEMRGERNLSTLRRNISRSGMYTRIWPVGYNDLHIGGAYLSKNESLYGRVDKVETNQGKTSEDSLRAWARAMLRKHCEPNVTITISGLELSQETGEPLDWIQLNRVCRCPLPEFHTTILERVIKIAWRDRRKDPESITVTLGNNAADVQDLTKTVSETSKSSGSAARGQAKQNYLFEANGEHLLYEVFDECGHLHGVLRMTEQSLRVAFENLNECTRSEFYMTSESLRVQFENEINSTRSEFQMTSESLRVTFENEINSTRSQIEVTSESLRTQFENEINSTRSQMEITSESLRVTFENEINSTRLQIEATSESLRSTIQDTKEGLETQIEQTKEAVRLKVSKGDVGTQLAVELGNVSITGGNLVVDGYVTAAGLEASIAELSVVRVKSIQAEGTAANLSLPTVTAQSNLYVGTGAGSVELIGAGITDAITDLNLSHTAGTATYTLQKKTISSHSSWTDVGSFSKAATLSVEYGGDNTGDTATFTVTGTPSENFPGGNSATGTFTVHQSKVAAYIQDANGAVRARINNPQYGNGWAAAYGEVDLPKTSSTADSFNVKTPKSATDGGANTETYTLSSATNDIVVVKNLTGTIVARLEHGKYTAGHTQGVLDGEAEFEAVDIRLQGESEGVYVPDSENGTTYYTAGSAITRYKGDGTRLGASGTYYKGNGGSVTGRGTSETVYVADDKGSYYLRGDSCTRYTSGDDKTYYLRDSNSGIKLKHDGEKTYYVAPTVGATGYKRDWYYIDNGGTNYYKAGGSVNVTLRGTAGTYYKGNGTQLAKVTRYKGDGDAVTGRGDSVTAYPTDSAGTNYLRGTAEVITPISASSIKVTNNTRYKAGTRYNKNKYYQKTS